MVIGYKKKRFPSSLVSIIFCMAVVLLLGRNLVKNSAQAWTPTCITRTISSASASSVATTPSRHFSPLLLLSLARGGGSSTGSIQSLRGLSSLDSSPSNNQEGDEAPKTGWNHNLPDKSSPFWQSPQNGEGGASRQTQEQASSTSKASRTGWLHNTKSNAELEKEKQQQQQQQQQTGGSSVTESSSSVGNKAQLRLQQAMMQTQRNHRIVEPPTFHACGKTRQVVVTEHRISLPVDRTTEDTEKRGDRIDVAFAIVEEVKDAATQQFFSSLQSLPPNKRAQVYVEHAGLANADDMMVYLQGGPGFGSPTPVVGLGLGSESTWAGKALGSYYKRIVLLDQRGTGRSTPITRQSLEEQFQHLFQLEESDDMVGKDWEEGLKNLSVTNPDVHDAFQTSLHDAVHYLSQMRADNIVKDAEDIREALMLPLEPGVEPGPRPWGGALGQSFGGFCMMSYLSLIEHPPKVCLLTGGIAPMLTPAYDAYTSLWDRVKERSLLYYDMYPGDVALVKKIVQTLLLEPAKLPSGGLLTARRFLQLGMALGGSPSSFASMHSLFTSAFLLPDEKKFTRSFLKEIDSRQPFDDNPIYFWLHEAIYGDGPTASPTNWTAHRAYEALVGTRTEFDYLQTSQSESDEEPILFFGEMVFPWMAEDYEELRGVGMTALAHTLARKESWGPLYDGTQMRSRLDKKTGQSVAAAAVYYDDMYVDFDCCMKVTARGGPLEQCKVYITNDYQHGGLRDDGANIFAKLHGMATGSVRTPS